MRIGDSGRGFSLRRARGHSCRRAVLRRLWLFRGRTIRNSDVGRSYFASGPYDEALRRRLTNERKSKKL